MTDFQHPLQKQEVRQAKIDMIFDLLGAAFPAHNSLLKTQADGLTLDEAYEVVHSFIQLQKTHMRVGRRLQRMFNNNNK